MYVVTIANFMCATMTSLSDCDSLDGEWVGGVGWLWVAYLISLHQEYIVSTQHPEQLKVQNCPLYHAIIHKTEKTLKM